MEWCDKLTESLIALCIEGMEPDPNPYTQGVLVKCCCTESMTGTTRLPLFVTEKDLNVPTRNVRTKSEPNQ